jgi:hypothetical protein
MKPTVADYRTRNLLILPNALWCTDYKGEFILGNKRYCYPLTVSDHASRYLLLCEAMESVKEQDACFRNVL